MEKDDVFEIFSFLSKAVIIIPITVVIIALIYKLNQTQSSNPKTKNQNLNLQANQSQNNTQSKITLDLDGQWTCSNRIDNLSIFVYIKDKKIKAIFDQKTKKENLLLADDCFYRWQEGQFNGEKICGLSPMVAAAQTMLSFTGIEPSLLTSQLIKFGVDQNIATNEAKISQLIQGCKKQNIDAKTFEIPGNILFKNKK